MTPTGMMGMARAMARAMAKGMKAKGMMAMAPLGARAPCWARMMARAVATLIHSQRRRDGREIVAEIAAHRRIESRAAPSTSPAAAPPHASTSPAAAPPHEHCPSPKSSGRCQMPSPKYSGRCQMRARRARWPAQHGARPAQYGARPAQHGAHSDQNGAHPAQHGAWSAQAPRHPRPTYTVGTDGAPTCSEKMRTCSERMPTCSERMHHEQEGMLGGIR